MPVVQRGWIPEVQPVHFPHVPGVQILCHNLKPLCLGLGYHPVTSPRGPTISLRQQSPGCENSRDPGPGNHLSCVLGFGSQIEGLLPTHLGPQLHFLIELGLSQRTEKRDLFTQFLLSTSTLVKCPLAGRHRGCFLKGDQQLYPSPPH